MRMRSKVLKYKIEKSAEVRRMKPIIKKTI